MADNIRVVKGSQEFGDEERALKYYVKLIKNPDRDLSDREKQYIAESIAEAIYDELNTF